MPTRDEIELELLRFLHESKERAKNEENGVRQAIGNVANQVELLSQKIEANYALTSERISGLAARVDALEKDVDDTGVHNIARLKEERDEARQDSRKIVHMLIAAGIALLGGGGAVEIAHKLLH